MIIVGLVIFFSCSIKNAGVLCSRHPLPSGEQRKLAAQTDHGDIFPAVRELEESLTDPANHLSNLTAIQAEGIETHFRENAKSIRPSGASRASATLQ